MKWIKINKDLTNLPKFKEIVLLFEKKAEDEKPHKADVGYLKSIDENGLNWVISPSDDIFSGFMRKPDFNPTHYCYIEIPDDENED